jgi:4,5-dihydroxyphthalate decarboxylase
MRRSLTLACGDYSITQALIDGTVKPEALDLNWITIPHAEMWRRMLNHYEFDASELSFSSYIVARTLNHPLIAIPIFPGRAFRHSYIFINSNSGIKEPQDLRGKRVGLGEFQQTATVWVRGILQNEYGVPPEMIRWFTWAKRSSFNVDFPKEYDIRKVPSDKSPDKMLMDGELDAVICTSLFESFREGAPNVRRLFPNYKDVEIAYFKKTGIFPIMHTLVLREELWRECPWIATSLYKAFQKAKELAYERFNDISPYKICMAWFREPMEEQNRVLGNDPWMYGLEKNRTTIETLVQYLYQQGMIKRKPAIEELFAPNTLT